MSWKEYFINTMKQYGECYVNYLLNKTRTTLHYKLEQPNDFIVEHFGGHEVYGCCRLDAENLEEWITFKNIESITPNNINK